MSGLLSERLIDVCSRFSSRESIVSGARRITYGELGRDILRAARALRERVEGGSRIAVVLENSPEYVAACFGTWIAGGVLVGLNPGLKAVELARLVAHSGARCLVLDTNHPERRSLIERVDPLVEILDLDLGRGFQGAVLGQDAGRLDPDSLAAIVYTSGTTGHPKGVMLSHRNLAANTQSIIASLPIRRDDKVLCVLPLQYSYGASIMHSNLVQCATLILERSLVYPHLVLERMVEEGVHTMAGVPSTFNLLLGRTNLAEYDLSALRYVTVAGGAMTRSQISRFRALVPRAGLFVMYGQTEASPRLTCLPAEDLDRKSGSAGRPIPGVELRIRDQSGRDLPPGVVGEVCVRGENVMLGYWNDPQETERVLEDGWLRTGDLGYMDQDGYLFLSGRLREMIKSGAHRIAPSEIEEVVRDVPGVLDVVVQGIADEVLGEVPKAWVVASQSDHELERRILHACQSRLARFKVPREVEFCIEFPTTPSGKIQRHLL